jgi:hypothetical protein
MDTGKNRYCAALPPPNRDCNEAGFISLRNLAPIGHKDEAYHKETYPVVTDPCLGSLSFLLNYNIIQNSIPIG